MEVSRRKTIGTLCDAVARQGKSKEKALKTLTNPPPKTRRPSFKSAFSQEFDRIDARNKRNLVSLAQMRQALPAYTRQQFDQGLNKLRKARLFTLNSFDGRHGTISAAMKKAAIIENGEPLIFVSRLARG